MVRRLHIPNAPVRDADLVVATLAALPNLTDLTLCMVGDKIVELGSKPVAFRLKRLSIRPQRVYEWLGLIHHQSASLTHLDIAPISSLPPVHSPCPPTCRALSLICPQTRLPALLPNITHISAPLEYIRLLSPRAFTSVTIVDALKREDLEPLMDTISTSPLNHLGITRYRFRADRIGKIAARFPGIKTMRMVSLHPSPRIESEFDLGDGFARFGALEGVRFDTGNPAIGRVKETRKALVETWGTQCTGLVWVVFGVGLEERWARDGKGGTWRIVE